MVSNYVAYAGAMPAWSRVYNATAQEASGPWVRDLGNGVLVATANFEPATRIGAKWYKKLVIPLFNAPDFDLIVLDADNVNRDTVFAELPEAIYISQLGHGNPECMAGQYNEIIYKYGDPEMKDVVSGRHFNLLSCSVGAPGGLGQWMVTGYGAKSVNCYQEDYIFAEGDVEKYFFGSHMTYDNVISLRKSVGDANGAALHAYEVAYEQAPEWVKPWILWNHDSMITYGDHSAVPFPEEPEPPGPGPDPEPPENGYEIPLWLMALIIGGTIAAVFILRWIF